MAPFYCYYKNFTAKIKIADYCSEHYVFASDLSNYQKNTFRFSEWKSHLNVFLLT